MKDKRDVFISYHTKSALQITELIAKTLEGRGISCWYAPRDCEDEWDDAIIQALGKADIFLLILSSYSSNSEQVKNEIKKAFDRYSKKEMSIIVFQVDDEPVSETVDYFLGRIHRVNGKIPPIEDRVLELVNRVEYTKVNGKKENLSEDSHFISAYVSPNIAFIGRKKELQEMEYALNNYRHVCISGMGGIGKTDLIREFVCSHKDKYRSVLWGTYTGSLVKLVCDDNIVKISNFFRNPPEEKDDSYFIRKMEFIKNHSSEADLLIIDNFNVPSDERLQELLELPISIILTSRSAQDENGIYDIKLKAMEDKEELFALFKRNYPRIITNEDRPIIDEIISYVKGHTMSIILISKLMRDKRINVSKMLQMLKDSNNDNNDVNNFINNALISLLNFSEINEGEKKVLSNLIFIPYYGISVETFYDYCKLDTYADVDSLISKNWILHDSSLDYISFHPLVAHLINKQIGTPDEYVGDYLSSIIEKMNNAKYLNVEEKEFLLPIIERDLRYIREDSKYYVDFYLAASRFFHAFARHLLTIHYMSKFMEKDFVPLPQKVDVQTAIADAYRCMHDSENLLIEIDKAKALYEQLDNKEDYPKLYVAIISRYGWYYMYIKEYQKAYNCFKEQLDIQLDKISYDLQDVGWSYFTVGYSLEMMEKYEEAISYHEKALSYFKEIKMDFAIANSLKSIAGIYVKINELDKAKEYLEQALGLFIKNVGEIHNDTALTKRSLANVYRLLNINASLAEKYEEDANKILKDLGYQG